MLNACSRSVCLPPNQLKEALEFSARNFTGLVYNQPAQQENSDFGLCTTSSVYCNLQFCLAVNSITPPEHLSVG